MERVADYLVDCLVESGIRHIFLITGRGILYLTDAVARNPKIQAVPAYHEQGASYAAMAYAAAADGMAACLVSTGCAATNAVTAALCAYQDNLPVIFISGQNMLRETTAYTGLPIRTFGSQEANIVPVVQSVTKYAVMLTDPRQVGVEMDKAVYFANEGRKGPVWIDVPLDIQNARVDTNELERFVPDAERQARKISIADIESTVEHMNAAERPVVFIGGGIRSSNAIRQIKEFVETFRVPLVFSPSAADAYGSAHELSVGAVGSLGGSRAGNFAVQNADFVLAVGTKLCSQSVGNFDDFARAAKVFVVDIDPEEHKKAGVLIDRLITADAKEFLEALLKQNVKIVSNSWTEQCIRWKEVFSVKREAFVQELVRNDEIDLYSFADTLSDFLPEDAAVITDAGFEELIIPSTIRYRGTHRCLFPAAQGAMGYAIPAILGAWFAGKKQIIAVVGDGSFMMNMQELRLIEAYGIPVKLFVINNNMYAVIRKRQRDLFRKRTIANDPSDGLPAPNFKKIADCFGIDYEEIASQQKLRDEIARVLKADGPVLCEVHCTPDQNYFHMSFAVNEKRRLVRRPLEDLSPFIGRERMKAEMIVLPPEE